MASIKCIQCDYGIRYTEPSGIEYIIITADDWNTICESVFGPNRVQLDETGRYPKLFKSDTIEDDFPGSIKKVWKCPKCGCIHVFDKEGKRIESYHQSNTDDLGELIYEGIIFSDYLWEKITDRALPNRELKNQKPNAFLKVFEKGMIASEKKDFSECMIYEVKLD